MSAFVSSGLAVDVVLAVIALEFSVLALLSRMGRSRMSVADAFFALAPGACLLLALRAAILEQGWLLIAVWVAASFPLHLIDLWRRR